MTANSFTLELDHLVVTAPTLESGVDHVRHALGCTLPFGGSHALMSTHNALMGLGGGAYLEVIAPDPEAPVPRRPRWYALDNVQSPGLSHWVVRTNDLDAALAQCGPWAGEAIDVSRGDLHWRLGVPADGLLPLGGAFPTLIEWPDGKGPADKLPDLGFTLESTAVCSPDADRITAFFGDRFSDPRVSVSPAQGTGITAQIKSRDGPLARLGETTS